MDEISGLDLVSGKKKTIHIKEAKLGTVVVFLSAHCPCSQSHQPEIDRIAKEFAPFGFQFVGVHSNVNETEEESQQVFKILSFPVLQDNNAKIANEYEAFKTPHVFIVNSQLETLFQGGIDDSRVFQKSNKPYLREALMAIQKGQKPSKDKVRVLGCEIKRP